MKKYSLAICKNDPADYQIIAWTDFEKVMRKNNIGEALIFISADDASPVNLAKRAVLGSLIISKDHVKYFAEYCLVDHEDGDKLLPCMALLDADIKYAMIKAVEFRENKSIIQCVIFEKNNEFSVKEYELIRYDKGFNTQVN